MPAAVGETVSYRGLGDGMLYDARVVGVNPDGRLALEVALPGVKEPLGRGRVPWSEERTDARGVAMPKGAP